MTTELAELREAVIEFLAADEAFYAANPPLDSEADRLSDAHNRLIALSAPRKPQEAAGIDPEPDEWYRTPSMLKEFPEPHIVLRAS